jgi:hypothetical protein
MTREEAIVIQKAIRENLHETGKDFPYRDEMISVMKESCDMAIKALEQEPCEDAISREAVLAMSDYIGETSTYDDPLGKVEEVVRVKDIMALPPVIPAQSWNPMSNKQWIDFLVKSWGISRTSAKDMLHVMMSVKKEDNFKKQFSGAKMKGAEDAQ